jgi:diamine N-acetyltransferase
MEANKSALNVTLQEVTAATVREIASLDVSADQQGYVASNAISIAEAYFNKGAWFRAIYADDTAIGFVMLFDPTLPDALPKSGIERNEVALWRFMIDQRHQGQGFGRKALDLVCANVRNRPGINRLIASYVPGPTGPEAFYLSYGFTKTGRLRNRDQEIEVSFAL